MKPDECLSELKQHSLATKKILLAKVRALRGCVPKDFKFDRTEANAR